MVAIEKTEPSAPERRKKSVALLKTELKEDVKEMRAVYKRKETDPVWSDLDVFAAGDARIKSKLVKEIRSQVQRGETILAAQPMNELVG